MKYNLKKVGTIFSVYKHKKEMAKCYYNMRFKMHFAIKASREPSLRTKCDE